MPATIKDIATRLNLSVSTVCYALNGGPKPVSQDVRDRVKEVAQELGYRPNRHARSLITGRNMTVGVVFPAIEPNTMLSPFLQHALNGIVNAAEELQQDILLLSAADRNKPEGFPEEVLDSRIDGVIFIAPPAGSKAVELMTRKGMPFAVLGGQCKPPGMIFNVDNLGGVRQALEHLVDLGHTRIAHITGLTHQADGIQRLDAYRRFAADANLPIGPEYIRSGNFHVDGGVLGTRELLELPRRPTAIFCANDGMAFGAIQTALSMGVRVPEDLSIVGFDDHYMSAAFQPPLTTVRQPIEAMGASAIHAILDVMAGAPPVLGKVFPTTLVVRATTSRAKEHIS